MNSAGTSALSPSVTSTSVSFAYTGNIINMWLVDTPWTKSMPIGSSTGSHSQTSGALDIILPQYEVPTLVAVKADMRYHVVECKRYIYISQLPKN